MQIKSTPLFRQCFFISTTCFFATHTHTLWLARSLSLLCLFVDKQLEWYFVCTQLCGLCHAPLILFGVHKYPATIFSLSFYDSFVSVGLLDCRVECEWERERDESMCSRLQECLISNGRKTKRFSIYMAVDDDDDDDEKMKTNRCICKKSEAK